MTFLVTGATGFLGGHVADVLAERGEDVRVLARHHEDTTRLEALGVEVCRGDLADRQSLKAAVRGVDHVLHCAARTGPWGPEEEYETANIRGLGDLVSAALDAGARRFVHISSITVHGNDVRGAADETAPLRGDSNPYSRTKLLGEYLLREQIRERRAPVTIVRPGYIYGPRSVESFARIATMIRQGKMIIFGSGNNHIPLVYVRDVALGIVQASEAPRAVGGTYLLVNDEPVTQIAYLTTIAAELGVPPPRWRIPYHVALALGATAEAAGHATHRRQPPPVMRYGVHLLGGENRFNISRARCELGYAPQVNLAKGVRESVVWYRTTYGV